MDHNTPLYGGSKGIKIEKLNDIEKGDSANTKKITLHNHSGTHIDFPNHFFEEGKMSNNYNANFWIFNNPFILNISAKKNQIILLDEIQLKTIPNNTDFLIINTGFYKLRNKKEFWNNNPGFDPKLAELLRSKLPNLKILGMDSISLTSYQNRVLGRKSHREFLGRNDILLVEDMNLNNINGKITKIYCFPLLVDRVDGAPVTIIAEIDD
jgi:arylformamidase